MIVKKGKQTPRLNEEGVDAWCWAQSNSGKYHLVRRGTDARNLPDNYEAVGASDALYCVIADKISKGSSFMKLYKEPGMPHFNTMYKWYKNDANFRALVNQAKKIRAENFHDRLQNIAETVEESNSKSAKVAADIYKHLMAVGDREQYGNQTKITGDATQPVAFIFDTGIKRQNDAIPTEGGEVEEISLEAPEEESVE